MKKLVWVSAHDYFSAQICVAAGIDAILVGDSLGSAVYGLKSTREVTMEMMLRHSEAVLRGVPAEFPIIADMPFESYANPSIALKHARQFAQIGVRHLKLEGGAEVLPQIECLIENGFIITGHLGLLPQTAERFVVSGRGEEAERILADALALEQAGVAAVVLECVPTTLGRLVSNKLSVPVIGIGAGPETDGQVLVYSDLTGKVSADFSPKFLRRFADVRTLEKTAIQKFAASVRSGEFPDNSESYAS